MNSSPLHANRTSPKEQFRFRELSVSETAAEFELEVDPALSYFEGHFPGNPVLPGFATVDAAIESGRLWLKSGETPGVKTSVRKIIQAKFSGLIQPGDLLKFKLSRDANAIRVSVLKDTQLADIIFEI